MMQLNLIRHSLLIVISVTGLIMAPLSFAGEPTIATPATNQPAESSSKKPISTDRKRSGKLRSKFA